MRQQLDGSLIVDGSVTIRELNRAMDWDLPDEEAATVAGLVIHEARMIPDARQAFVFHGFRFEVLRRQKNRIAALRITPLAARAAETRALGSGRRSGGASTEASAAPFPDGTGGAASVAAFATTYLYKRANASAGGRREV